MRFVSGIIHSTESMTAVDGFGLRFLVFMQGCIRRCVFCQNPDTWERHGKRTTVQDVMDRVLREKSYLLPNKGGVTVSGGEPLLQPEFVTTLFQETRMAGLTTCLDTSGMGRTTDYTTLLENTDHVMLCVKSLNPILHHDISGVDIKHLYRFVGALDQAKSPFRVRHVLITDGKYKTNGDEEIDRLTDFINARDHCSGIEVLPYHSMGMPKWASLNKACPMQSTLSPTAAQVQDIITRLRDKLAPPKSIIV